MNIEKEVPDSDESTCTSHPMSSAECLTIESPSPVPPVLRDRPFSTR